MNKENPYVQRIRDWSPILNAKQRNVRNITVVEEDRANCLMHLALIEGTKDHPDRFWDPKYERWEVCYMVTQKEKLKEIQLKFKKHQQTQLNSGNRMPETYPPDLLEERLKVEANIQVKQEEVAMLNEWLKTAVDRIEEEAQVDFSVNPLNWPPGGSLRDGILCEINGQKCERNTEGILVIKEPRSQYDSLLVYRFKAEIMEVMGREYRRRINLEDKAAKRENRDKRPVPKPLAPVYDKASDLITYPGYSQHALSKLQTS